jgi:hypothetical protein
VHSPAGHAMHWQKPTVFTDMHQQRLIHTHRTHSCTTLLCAEHCTHQQGMRSTGRSRRSSQGCFPGMPWWGSRCGCRSRAWWHTTSSGTRQDQRGRLAGWCARLRS